MSLRPVEPTAEPAAGSPTGSPAHAPAAGDAPAPAAPDRSGVRGPSTGDRGEPSGGRRRPGGYRALFAHPGTAAFCAAGVVARLPMGVFTVATVIMITAHHGSYALAGAVTACGLATSATVAPMIARLVDRHGQARVAVPAVAVSALAQLSLLLCLFTGAPVWTLFAAYALSSGAPNVGGMVRARWALVLGPESVAGENRHRANALEQALDELCFMCGPVLAAVLCTTLFPEAGTLLGVVLMLTGTLALVAQRRTEPPAGGRPDRGAGARRSLLPALAPLLATFLCTGAIFGSMEVVTIAFADDLGRQGWAGAVLAAQAGGSALAGLAFGTLRPTGPAGRRFALCVGAMAVLMTLPALAAGAGDLLVLAPVLLVAGMATAPTMVSGMTLVQGTTPVDRLNEGMTLAVTALLGGLALGAAGGGWVVERAGAGGVGYLVPAVAAVCAALVAVPAFRRSGRTGNDPAAPSDPLSRDAAPGPGQAALPPAPHPDRPGPDAPSGHRGTGGARDRHRPS